jgi:hypothetical protein
MDAMNTKPKLSPALWHIRSRGFVRTVWALAAIVFLFGLSMYHSYSLGQNRTMYDNPIYRWRISMAVALSELHHPPLRGFVAYRSIVDYLNQHGLAIMPGEASPLPSFESVRKLVYDPERLEKLLRSAATIPIDYNLTPVPIVGSEKGEASFYYWSFRLFGIHLTSLWYFYFLLLGLSALAFFLTFWREPSSILLLLLYLVGHLYMVDVASADIFQTVHNSRFLPVLGLLPSMHLALLILRRTPPQLGNVALAIFQTLLLYFVMFNRVGAAWQIGAILAIAIIGLVSDKTIRKTAIAGWPAALVIIGGVAFVTYQHVALDRTAYAVETRNHTFWDPLLCGTISVSPDLTALYGLEQPPYSDTMDYFIARKYLIEHNDTTSPIAEVENGVVVGSFAMHNMGAYDQVLRKVFFQILHDHPWLVAWSFLYQKPRAELTILSESKRIGHFNIFWWCVFLAAASGMIINALAGQPIRQDKTITSATAICVSTLLSLATVFIFPTDDIPDTILLFLLVFLLLPALLPCLIASQLHSRLASSKTPQRSDRVDGVVCGRIRQPSKTG